MKRSIRIAYNGTKETRQRWGRNPPGKGQKMKPYTVAYKMFFHTDKAEEVIVLANNKEEAWEKAQFEEIPKKEYAPPYSAWVKGVTYQNGNYKRFNTFEGKPY